MDKPPSIPTIDGYSYSLEMEAKLNSVFASVFSTPGGGIILNYLKGITINTVIPHTESDARLRHHEGMRDLVRIIQERIKTGKEKPNDDSTSGQRSAIIARSNRRRGNRNPAKS
jgi:hypothetical protein